MYVYITISCTLKTGLLKCTSQMYITTFFVCSAVVPWLMRPYQAKVAVALKAPLQRHLPSLLSHSLEVQHLCRVRYCSVCEHAMVAQVKTVWLLKLSYD